MKRDGERWIIYARGCQTTHWELPGLHTPSLPLNTIDCRSPVIRLTPSCTPRRSSRPLHPRRSTSAAADWIFELRTSMAYRLYRAVHHTCPNTRSASRGHVTGSHAMVAPLRAQPGRQAKAAVDRGEAKSPRTPFVGFSSRPEVGFTLSPLGTRSNPWRCAIRIEAARQTGGKPERSQCEMSHFLIGYVAAVL